MSRKTNGQYQREKIIVSVVLIFLSIAIAGVHYNSSIFPSLPIGFLFTISTITIFFTSTKKCYVTSIVLLVGLAIFYRIFVFTYPESLLGLDPDVYAMNIHEITQTGKLEVIDIWFYSDASAFLIFGAVFDIIGGINAAKALVIFPIAIGVVFPVTAATITHRLTQNKRTSVYAAAIAAAGSISIWFSYWPIPQTLGTILWALFFLSIVIYEETDRTALFIFTGITLSTLVFTHKMPLIVILFGVGIYLLIHLINSAVVPEPQYINGRWVILGSLVAAAIVLQWTFLTDYLISVSFKIGELLTTETLSIQSPIDQNPSHAISAFSGLYGIFIRRVHAFVLVPLSGLGWLYLLLKDPQNRTAWVVLATSSAGVAFIAFGVINPLATSPVRALLMVEPFLAILVAIVITRVYTQRAPQWTHIARFALILILISQLSVVYVSPDHPSHARTYLSSEEVQGKQFGHENINAPIHGDGYFTDERTPYEIEHGIKVGQKYRSNTLGLLNGNLTDQEYRYIAYRTDVDVYRLEGGIWRLTWDPEIYLRNRYSKVYTNDGLDIYWNHS